MGVKWCRLGSETRVAMRRDVASIKHITKLIGKTSMIDYANEAMRGVSVVTTRYASV